TFGFGQQNGISFQLGMQNAKGRANGEETTWDNTLITATDSLSVKSGNDTTLRGAQLAANQVTMDVGRNLTIETLQDKSKYETEQKSGGFGISLCIPPICYGASSASVNASNQGVKHDYQSAQGQSGISAGAGGFDITVGNHTDLTGAAITSEADSSKNRLVTASLSSRDLVNTQTTDAHASSISVSGSTSGGFSDIANNLTTNLAGNKALKDGMPQSGSEQSQTLSVISPAQIQITGTGEPETDTKSQSTADELTTRDPKTANQSLKNTLTLQQAAELEKQLKEARDNAEAARQLTQLGQQIAGDIGTMAGKRATALNEEAEKALARGDKAGSDALKAEADKWGEGGVYRVALHTLAGALTGGGIEGALGAGASAATIPEIAEAIKQLGLAPEAQQTLITLAGAAVGGAVGGTSGAMTGLNQAVNNYLSHQEADTLIALKNKRLRGDCSSECSSEIQRLETLDKQRNQDLAACSGISSSICDGLLQEVRQAAASYIRANEVIKDQRYFIERGEALRLARESNCCIGALLRLDLNVALRRIQSAHSFAIARWVSLLRS
ncbi:MAG: hemagglutinin repeat-containing protein, partial [Rhodocyclaceae bacterium]|nr:hemagglutinin repeat-containing protein [Rhodocyclaceae bacterium]